MSLESTRTEAVTVELEREAPFAVVATAARPGPRLTLKHDDCFAVLDTLGDIDAEANGADGFYDFDTRSLSSLRLLLNGQNPLLLGYCVRDDSFNVDFDLTNPDICRNGHVVVPKDTLHVRRTIYAHGGTLRTRVALINHGHEPVDIEVGFAFNSDFADLFEVRGTERKRRGRRAKRLMGAGALLSYQGLDEKLRETTVSFWPQPASLHTGGATYRLSIAPGAVEKIVVTADSRARSAGTAISFARDLIYARRARRDTLREVPAIETSSPVLNEILRRALADFYMLVSATPQGPYPYAGIPWFSTTFGRDGLIAAMQMLWLDPRIARGVLTRLARFQSNGCDKTADAEPGKILHEMRSGEMAALGEVPFGCYYGSVDSTPLFVMLAGEYAARTGDDAFIAQLWPAIERALIWIDRHADLDGDGFIEYPGWSETGLSNQGWKDSYDSVSHADGTLARGPIALIEVQGYVYAARRLAAACARRLGRAQQAAALEAAAEALRVRFEASFWDAELATYVLALDGDKAPCRVRASNAGHALFTGIAAPERAKKVARSLLGAAFFSGWGVRTLAKGERRYNPLSYHNGSIWPHDNALIAAGLRRYGLGSSVVPIFEGLTEAAAHIEQNRLPELFCGFPRRKGRGPTLYPVACSPQAWASAAVFQLVQSLLGLAFDPAAPAVTLRDPQLPESVGELTVRNLRCGPARADFTLARDASGCVRLVEAAGPVSLLRGA